ncbi:hypothetical protein Aspvir_001721 [Aspergillus viridinutans]|uniref:Uncharacterized protein n=1 Tax=Aspergillus viridinutans TaxID=75553 RepID=A0A9P3BNG2_ASPVI|nr:uncharacterized protein Aspvir_001721 [Aspergillus viridinutans]GIJ99587.1 hypothetical protein Aspvir_001721 [Aspergillus viridinutans]
MPRHLQITPLSPNKQGRVVLKSTLNSNQKSIEIKLIQLLSFLSKWLFCIADCQTRRPLDEHESRLVSWITDIVEEGRTSGDDDLWSRPPSPSDCVYLGYAVAKLWARLIRGDEQWLLLKVIGDGLDVYADTCERNYAQPETVASVPT